MALLYPGDRFEVVVMVNRVSACKCLVHASLYLSLPLSLSILDPVRTCRLQPEPSF